MLAALCTLHTLTTFQTSYAQIEIDHTGRVVSLESRTSHKQYIPVGRPSPLLSLHESARPDDQLIAPVSAAWRGREIDLAYPNGAIAHVKAQVKGSYLRLQLVSLANRGKVDDVVWGPLSTTVSRKIGDLIGVVRGDDWAVGMMGLDDNTIAGTPCPGDAYGMQYYVHSPDPKLYPLPKNLKEGQVFNIGGDGVSDVAFYSHPEEYFQMVCGTGAKLEPQFGSTIAYHSRDRRKPRTFAYSLLPHFPGSRPRTQVTDPVTADFVGSSVALFACPDRKGLTVIEDVCVREGLPHVQMDGKWVRDPTGFKTDMAWYGPHDKLVEYADALGLKAVQDEGQGEYYANPVDHWQGPRVGFSDGTKLTYKQYGEELAKHGIKYGLHTLCLFAQAGRCSDVSPNASANLQTILRTKLANDIMPKDTAITVTDPSYLAEDGTWPMRDGANTLRIGTELIKYAGISEHAPYILKGIQRGQFGTVAQPHPAGVEVAKLQMNCYNGFVPDIDGMLDYADYYARVMAENCMEYIDFDGLESTLYQGQGYFGVRRFLRRFVETFQKLTGKAPRIMGSAVFSGGWEYMSVCNVGGGANMFDPVQNRWGIEGKDVRDGFGNSYFPPTFGIQDYQSDWSMYDAENLQAKAIGWDATYMLGLSQDAVERSGEKPRIFKAFRLWEDARVEGAFPPAVKAELRDLSLKFHLEQDGKSGLVLTPIREIRSAYGEIDNPFGGQPLQFALRIGERADRIDIGLPGGGRVSGEGKFAVGEFVVFENGHAYLADKYRKKLSNLTVSGSSLLPNSRSKITAPAKSELTVWAVGPPIRLGDGGGRQG